MELEQYMLDKGQRSKKEESIGHQNMRVRADHLPFLKKTPKPQQSQIKAIRVTIKASLRMKIQAVFQDSCSM